MDRSPPSRGPGKGKDAVRNARSTNDKVVHGKNGITDTGGSSNMVDRKLPRPPRAKAPAAASQDRRNFLKTAATGTVAGVAAATTGMGFNIKTAKAQGTRWKMQSSWAPGTTGYKIFEEWGRQGRRGHGRRTADPALPGRAPFPAISSWWMPCAMVCWMA